MISGLELSVPPSELQRGMLGWKLNQSCLRNEASIKKTQNTGPESICVGEHLAGGKHVILQDCQESILRDPYMEAHGVIRFNWVKIESCP